MGLVALNLRNRLLAAALAAVLLVFTDALIFFASRAVADAPGYEEGYADGYAVGYEEGYAAGLLDGKEEGALSSSVRSAQKSTPTLKPTATPRTANYIANTNTKKFHKPSCKSVKQMKESNKWYFTGTRDELIRKGYSPCKICSP